MKLFLFAEAGPIDCAQGYRIVRAKNEKDARDILKEQANASFNRLDDKAFQNKVLNEIDKFECMELEPNGERQVLLEWGL